MSKLLSEADLRRIHKIHAVRVRAAEKANVAIGWVSENGEVNPKAPQLSKRAKP